MKQPNQGDKKGKEVSESGTNGPTWEDVHDYLHRLETESGFTIFLQMRLFKAGRPERLCGSATALAVPAALPLSEAVATGYHGFKGQQGAKTAPMAYWFALVELESKLNALRHREAAQNRF